MDAEPNATTPNGRNGTAWTPSSGFLNRARRFESWRGRVCAGQGVVRATRGDSIHRCAKPMRDRRAHAHINDRPVDTTRTRPTAIGTETGRCNRRRSAPKLPESGSLKPMTASSTDWLWVRVVIWVCMMP